MADERSTSRGGRRPGAARPKDRRIITVLFADVVDSTRLIADNDPELAAGILMPAIELLATTAEGFGGTVTHRLGDGLVALFGVPLVLEDHAVRACHAAVAMQERIARYVVGLSGKRGADLRIRVGLNSGLVVASTASDGQHTEYDASGPTVHLASRVESQTPPGGVGLSEATHERVRHLFECASLGLKALKGFAEPQEIYQLIRPKRDAAAGRSGGAYSVDTPFVGRHDLLDAMTGRILRLADGEGGIVLVTGEAGLGKTRLLSETRSLAPQSVRWYVGHSLSFGQRLSYWPFVEILRAAIGLSEIDDEATNWQKLVDRCTELFAADASEIIPYVATLFSWHARAPYAERTRYLDAEALGAQILRAVWRLIQRLAADGPLVLVIEDLHWIDGSSATLLEHLLPLCATTSLLICVLSRPDEESVKRFRTRASGLEAVKMEELVLVPLSALESLGMINHIIGRDATIDRIGDRILYKAGGNPFFLKEVIRTLIDTKALVRDAVSAEWSVRDHDAAIPDTIQGVIMARIDRLDERLRQVLSVASVIGRSFLYRVLRDVDQQERDLDDRLQTLRAIELIDELRSVPELEYIFHHALAQETIYESLLLVTRQKLHDRVAACLETLYAGRTHEIMSLLAYHYARAENWPKALECLLKAADQSSQIAADDEAVLHYEDALEAYTRVVGDKWERAERAAILRRLGEVHFRRGDSSQGRQHLRTALALYGDALPSSRIRRHWMILQGLVRQFCHRILPSRLVAPPKSQIPAEAETHIRLYEVISWINNFVDQEEMFRGIVRALNLSDQLGFAEGQTKGSAAFGYALDQVGFSRLSSWYFARAQYLLKHFDNSASVGSVCMFSAIHEMLKGRWDLALSFWARSLDAARRAGDLSTWSIATIQRSYVLGEVGHLHEALATGDELALAGRESAFHLALRAGTLARGAILRRLGDLDAARDTLHEAVALATAAHDSIMIAVGKSELGQVSIDEKHYEGAVSVLRDALETLRRGRVSLYIRVVPHVVYAEALVGMLQSSPNARNDRSVVREAARACRRSLALAQRYKQGLTQALRVRGTLDWVTGRRAQAMSWWRRSIETGERLGARYEVALTRMQMGTMGGDAGGVAQAEQLLRTMRAQPSSVPAARDPVATEE
jgi:class 3 adenylate cyclase/tetratricopeptide (TPR) repeat protein